MILKMILVKNQIIIKKHFNHLDKMILIVLIVKIILQIYYQIVFNIINKLI